jgi:hypothetical protein
MSTAPKPPDNDSAPTTTSGWYRAYAVDHSRLQWWIAALILVSIGDLAMTYYLLSHDSRFYESNPIADWFFQRWNIAGMTFFKFAVVAFVIVIAEFVERKRKGTGKFVLLFGIVVTAYVIYYSYMLYRNHLQSGG